MTRHATRKTGTREWSDVSVNCCLGCRHGCLYCYARQAALRWGRIANGGDWTNERPRPVEGRRPKRRGVVMFPTAHDITVGNAGACLATLINALRAGNRVLVVSKAGSHVPSLLDAARSLAGKGSLELRVSLTCLAPEVARFWEPGAPTPTERTEALMIAYMMGLDTSVSVEPCLEPERAEEIVEAAENASVFGEIWIGAANKLRERTAWCRDRLGLEGEIRRLEAGQTPQKMREVYELLRGNPQIRWKDSYQRALGIDALGRRGGG